MTSTPRILHAATGSTLTAKGWGQEAALRMLHNNLDPAVAEHPENLVVYGGTGKAARNWLLTRLWIQERVSPEAMKQPMYVLDEPWENSLACGSMSMVQERKEQIQNKSILSNRLEMRHKVMHCASRTLCGLFVMPKDCGNKIDCRICR